MSCSNLFDPNCDYNLYCNNLNSKNLIISGNQTVNGILTVNSNEILNGFLLVPTAPGGGLLLGTGNDRWLINNNPFNSLVIAQQGATINKDFFILVGTGNLVVDGNMHLTNGFRDSTNSLGTNGQILSSTGVATQWISNIKHIYCQSATNVASGNYIGISGNSVLYFNSAILVANSMNLDQLDITVGAAPGVGNSYQFILYKNGIITANSITISNNATSGNIAFLEPMIAGDTFSVRLNIIGAANPVVLMTYSTT